jgi:hypothetical protein
MLATTLVADVVDWSTRAPVAGAQIELCGFTDQNCTRPVAEAGTGEGGVALLALPALSSTSPLFGFGRSPDSFAQVTSPGVIVPALYFLGYPVSTAVANLANPFVLVATPDDARTGGVLLPPDAGWDMTTTGWIGFLVFDCGPTPFPAAASVEVTMDPPDPKARTYYFQNGVAANFTRTATDSSGLGGIVNVTPGDVTLTARPLALGGEPSSVGHVHVRAGTLSVLFMFPTPGTSQADR